MSKIRVNSIISIFIHVAGNKSHIFEFKNIKCVENCPELYNCFDGWNRQNANYDFVFITVRLFQNHSTSIWPWPTKLTDCGRPSSDAKLSELGFGFGYLKGYKSDLLSLSWSSVHLRGVYPLFERGLDTGLARRTLLCHHHSCSVYSSDGNRHLRCLQTYRHKNLFLEALRDSSKWIAIKSEVKLKPEINGRILNQILV